MAFLNLRSWYLFNVDTGQLFQSQFEPEGLTRNVQANYAQHTALNRANPILQFLNKEAETCSFQATLFRQSVAVNNVEEDLALLQSWAEPAEGGQGNSKPPVLIFSVGDGFYNLDCVLESLSNITYGGEGGRQTFDGGVRKVTFTVNLRQYQEFELDSALISETRYHRAKERDYYELIAQVEYGSAIKGDIIRKRNPDKPNMQLGDRVPFPSIEAIRRDRVEPKSMALSTAYGKKPTPQKQLRLDMFDRRNRPYVSHIILEH